MAPPHLLLLVLVLLLFFSSHLSSVSSSNSVTLNQPLSGSQKLISPSGAFELGFFKPGNSPYYYIGIWYSLARVSQQTAVWVANRDVPIADPTRTHLKISATDGNLILSNQSNPSIWSTNTTTFPSKPTTIVAVLLDTGNLVLRDSANNNTFWQSIDHPTHTWLPGGKLGLNKVTGELQKLISWKNENDPAPGIFNIEIDPNGTGQYYILWNRSFVYWTSGIWNGQIFSDVPEMTANYIYDFEYVTNASENYFTYSVKNLTSTISRFIMDVSGQVKQLTWIPGSQEWIQFWSQPRAQCQVHALCGPYGSCNENSVTPCNCVKGFVQKFPSEWNSSGWSGGCKRRTELQCGEDGSGKRENDKFFTMTGMQLPVNPQTLQVASASECESGCLKNCSCTAYSYGSSGCSVWYGDLLNLQEQYSGQGGGTLFLRLAASELPSSKSKKGAVIGGVVGGVLGSLALLVILWLLIRRKRSGKPKVIEGGLVAFRYIDLQRATKNFSEKLGGGGFGSVFKGILPNSTAIAVKKLEGVQQGEKQFRTEVSTIGTIQHVNLVRLHGFCSEQDHKLLVYEYMPNGSLDSQLFQTVSSSKVLDWKTRYQIALGTARGLTYLHEQCRDCIVHCDIKPENILLDASFIPKVADFGLAKLIGRDFSRALTTMRGTRGYLAPEWISGVAITAKADVYSYGMMMFEVISGKRNLDQTQDSKNMYFPALAVNKLIEGDPLSLLDGRLEGESNLEEVNRACKVACWCIQDDENCRPTMGQVVQILEGVLEVNMPPVPRALQIISENPGNIVFFTESSSTQNSRTTQSSSSTSTSTGSQTKSTSSASTKD